MLNKPEFPFLVIAIAGVLLAWPLVDVYRQFGPVGRLGYFFVIWAMVVLLYALWSKRAR